MIPDELEIHVNDGGNNVDIVATSNSIPGFNIVGIVSANVHFSDDNKNGKVWWIARVKLSKGVPTGQGIGSILLEVLKNEIKKRKCILIVCPGGYNGNRKQQFNFYIKNGFDYVDGDKDTLQWDPNWKHKISNRPNIKRLNILVNDIGQKK